MGVGQVSVIKQECTSGVHMHTSLLGCVQIATTRLFFMYVYSTHGGAISCAYHTVCAVITSLPIQVAQNPLLIPPNKVEKMTLPGTKHVTSAKSPPHSPKQGRKDDTAWHKTCDLSNPNIRMYI